LVSAHPGAQTVTPRTGSAKLFECREAVASPELLCSCRPTREPARSVAAADEAHGWTFASTNHRFHDYKQAPDGARCVLSDSGTSSRNHPSSVSAVRFASQIERPEALDRRRHIIMTGLRGGCGEAVQCRLSRGQWKARDIPRERSPRHGRGFVLWGVRPRCALHAPQTAHSHAAWAGLR